MSGTDSSVVYKVPIPPTMSSPELMTQSETAIIQMERVSLRYGRGPEILSGIDLALQPGSFSFLTGASGAGKSSLLGMLARNAECDVVVLAMIGERGREVREFLDRQLPPEVASRCITVVSTSDRPACLLYTSDAADE